MLLLPVVLAVAVVVPVGAALPDEARSEGYATAIVPDELAACVRTEQASRPRLTYVEGVVRCVRPVRVETTTVIRWSTCSGGTAYQGDYPCETGSARISIRSTRAELEFRPPPRGWPRNARRWHLYGSGTASCTRVSHGLKAGSADTSESVSGRINHVDFAVLWPSIPSDGTVALGVTPQWNNPLPETLKNAINRPRPCRPSFAVADGFVTQTQQGISIAELVSTDGVTARIRKRFVVGLGVPLPAWIGPLIAEPLIINIDTRISATFVTKY